jgi:hypothetical protein
MEGYVYIARIIDHGGKFVNGYHKIGLSKQYKVRETQLNSTHLPFDVLMVRVFETEDMNKLEGLLHLCFEDYRVVKEYDYRRNITTEWFDVSDIDVFNERLDKFIELMGVNELDITKSIDSDNTLTPEEKEIEKARVGKAKSTKLNIIMGEKIFDGKTSKESYITFVDEVTKDLNTEELLNGLPSYFGETSESFTESLNDYHKTKLTNGLYFNSWGSNKTKETRINKICEFLKLTNVKIQITQ